MIQALRADRPNNDTQLYGCEQAFPALQSLSFPTGQSSEFECFLRESGQVQWGIRWEETNTEPGAERGPPQWLGPSMLAAIIQQGHLLAGSGHQLSNQTPGRA